MIFLFWFIESAFAPRNKIYNAQAILDLWLYYDQYSFGANLLSFMYFSIQQYAIWNKGFVYFDSVG
jgi:hypothetical protein